MMSKPVMVTAPLMAAWYDRVFLAGSWRKAWQARRRLYLALASTWLLLAAALLLTRRDYGESAGWSVPQLSPLAYAVNQPAVLLHYLRLAVWPHPLVLDYAWPQARTLGAIAGPLAAAAGLLAATAWALRRAPAAGFLGVWYFLILAPTSSLIPIADLAFEHRMYLPLAAPIAGAVIGVFALFNRMRSVRPAGRARAAAALTAAAVVGFTGLTIHRNADYQSAVGIWQDTVNRRPSNPYARNNLGFALVEAGRPADAVPHLQEALRLKPDYADAHNNLGNAYLIGQGHLEAATRCYRRALEAAPGHAEAHHNLGFVLQEQGRLDEALVHYREALRLRPGYRTAQDHLRQLLARLEDGSAAPGRTTGP
jgi:Flp pilus assembly protein TadD